MILRFVQGRGRCDGIAMMVKVKLVALSGLISRWQQRLERSRGIENQNNSNRFLVAGLLVL